MIAIVFAAALASASPDSDTLVRDYNLCMRRMAEKLEPSGESPTDIANAAKAFCSDQRFKALNSARDFNGGTTASIDEMERAAEFYARAQVVAVRLCKKTGDCALTKIP